MYNYTYIYIHVIYNPSMSTRLAKRMSSRNGVIFYWEERDPLGYSETMDHTSRSTTSEFSTSAGAQVVACEALLRHHRPAGPTHHLLVHLPVRYCCKIQCTDGVSYREERAYTRPRAFTQPYAPLPARYTLCSMVARYGRRVVGGKSRY
jgi:hypothetical protein